MLQSHHLSRNAMEGHLFVRNVLSNKPLLMRDCSFQVNMANLILKLKQEPELTSYKTPLVCGLQSVLLFRYEDGQQERPFGSLKIQSAWLQMCRVTNSTLIFSNGLSNPQVFLKNVFAPVVTFAVFLLSDTSQSLLPVHLHRFSPKERTQ